MENKQQGFTLTHTDAKERFVEFLNGNAVVQVSSPIELYYMQKIFRYTSFNLFNMIMYEDISLIQSVLVSKRAQAIDVSSYPNIVNMPSESLTDIICGIGTDHVASFLAKRKMKYPMYLMVKPEGIWDDSVYECDPTLKSMYRNAEGKSTMSQVIDLYLTGEQLFSTDNLAGLRLTPTLTVKTRYEFDKTTGNVVDVLSGKQYPVTKVPPFAMAYKGLMTSHREYECATTRWIDVLTESLVPMIGESCKTDADSVMMREFLQAAGDFNSGYTAYTFHTDDELKTFFEYEDFFLKENPPYVENNFPLTLAVVDGTTIGLVDPEQFKEIPPIHMPPESGAPDIHFRVVEFSTVMKGAKKFIEVYNENLSAYFNLIKTQGVSFFHVPAKLVMRIQQSIVDDMVMQYRVEHPEESENLDKIQAVSPAISIESASNLLLDDGENGETSSESDQ